MYLAVSTAPTTRATHNIKPQRLKEISKGKMTNRLRRKTQNANNKANVLRTPISKLYVLKTKLVSVELPATLVNFDLSIRKS